MVKVVTRRLRCEVQGCHQRAFIGLGSKGFDYPLCEKHAKMLNEELADLFKPEKPKKKKVEEVLAPKEIVLDDLVIKESKETLGIVEEPQEEFYVCKYCGEKFSKSEMSPAKFATHVRQCKAEHQYED